ncbi:MAG: hypothetical protein ABII97_00735 [Patescibacteria group bacterium]
MNILNWRAKQKLIYFLIVFGVIVGAISFFVYFSLPDPTCVDGKKNGEESGIDCGGSCDPCVGNVKDVVVLWTRVFKHGEGEGDYEVASLIKNPNLSYSLPKLRYVFKVYDSSNILVAVREGETFLNPQDEFVIYETNIDTGKRDAQRALIEIDVMSEWQYSDKERPTLIVSEKSFSNLPFPTLSVRLTNQSIFTVKDIFVNAVLYDVFGNVMAVSSTKVDSISRESDRNISFTWPDSFLEEPSSNKIFTRINSFLDD